MDLLELEKFLKELGGFEQEILISAVEQGSQMIDERGNICLKDLYVIIANEKGISAKQVEKRIRSGLELMGYRGNVKMVEETFGRRYGRIHVTPRQFIYTMIEKFT